MFQELVFWRQVLPNNTSLLYDLALQQPHHLFPRIVSVLAQVGVRIFLHGTFAKAGLQRLQLLSFSPSLFSKHCLIFLRACLGQKAVRTVLKHWTTTFRKSFQATATTVPRVPRLVWKWRPQIPARFAGWGTCLPVRRFPSRSFCLLLLPTRQAEISQKNEKTMTKCNYSGSAIRDEMSSWIKTCRSLCGQNKGRKKCHSTGNQRVTLSEAAA